MVREIGSEYHKVMFDAGHGFTLPHPGPLLFSGRTAFETVLKEIPEAKKAILPSYCCDSMIEPFRRRGIDVDFYSVNYENGLKIEIEISKDAEIIVWCNYFGFNVFMPDLTTFTNCGGVIIEDVTHSLFSQLSYHSQSDYLVASLRKWGPVYCGGYCAAVNGELHCVPITTPPQDFSLKKKAAMELKTEYLTEFNEEKKQKFLLLFGESNRWLAENYSNLAIDPWSQEYFATMDMEEQKCIRKKNAKFLYKHLKKAKFLFSEQDMDCPLFVPILLSNRDEVRRRLIENQIYCPVHWPHPKAKCESNLYDMELSLICDQRYKEEDMERIISVLQTLI